MTGSFYNEPVGTMTTVANRTIRWLADHGVSVSGARTLVVAGRRSGKLQEVPVNLLELDGGLYLVSPRGNTQWSRNVRAAGELELRLGRRSERYRASVVAGEDTVPVVRAYLARWIKQVRSVLPAPVDADSSESDLAAVAAQLPVFALQPIGRADR